MELSYLVAKMIGAAHILLGATLLKGDLKIEQMISEFKKSRSLTFLAGFLNLFLGMLLVEYHSVWVWQWPVLITICGYIMIIKSIILILFPEFISRFKWFFNKPKVLGGVIFLTGIILMYLGLNVQN